MKIQESIKNIILMSGSVSVPYKAKFKDWYGKIELTSYFDGYGNSYTISGSCTYTTFKNIDDAINFFCEKAYSSKNIGYLHKRLLDRKVLDDDFDFEEISKSEKNIFNEEGKIVDEELLNMGVTSTKFPKKSDANSEYEDVIKITDIDELKNRLNIFNDRYISIDYKINVYAKFIYDNGTNNPHDYRVSLEPSFTLERIVKIEKENSILKFKCLNLSLRTDSGILINDIYIKN